MKLTDIYMVEAKSYPNGFTLKGKKAYDTSYTFVNGSWVKYKGDAKVGVIPTDQVAVFNKKADKYIHEYNSDKSNLPIGQVEKIKGVKYIFNGDDFVRMDGRKDEEDVAPYKLDADTTNLFKSFFVNKQASKDTENTNKEQNKQVADDEKQEPNEVVDADDKLSGLVSDIKNNADATKIITNIQRGDKTSLFVADILLANKRKEVLDEISSLLSKR